MESKHLTDKPRLNRAAIVLVATLLILLSTWFYCVDLFVVAGRRLLLGFKRLVSLLFWGRKQTALLVFWSLLILTGLGFSQAQSNFGTVSYVVVAPSGTCQAGTQLQVVISTGSLYSCQSNTWTAISSSSVSTQAYPQVGTSSSGSLGLPEYVSAAAFDATPSSPSTPCPDLVAAELSGVGGNFAVPTSGLGLSNGTPLPCTTNPFATAKDGSITLPSGTLQMEYSGVIPAQSVTSGGPTNIFGSGHSGTCGSNGKCATYLQGQVGMWYAQDGNVTVTSANPPTVTFSTSESPSATKRGAIFNTSWKGLMFGMFDASTGIFYSSLISAVTCTNSAGIACTTESMTLTGTSWPGPTGVNQSYWIGFPGTVKVTNANPPTVLGVGTSFDSSWVGVTFDAAPMPGGGTGGLCGATICTVASVTDATHLTLSGTSWTGSTATGNGYTLGSVYGPIFSFAQASLPVTQGSSISNLTIDANNSAGYQRGQSCLEQFFGQELTQVSKIKLNNCPTSSLFIGGGGFYNTAANGGPFVDFEVVTSLTGANNPYINPTAATVTAITSGALVGSGVAYPVRAAYAIYTFSAAPAPNIARGQLMSCTGNAAGTSGTNYNVNAVVLDQITPTQAYTYIATTHATDSSTGGGTCLFYPSLVMTGNHPFYRNRGIFNGTVNAGTGGTKFAYTSNKPAYDGTPASTNLPVAYELAGGAGAYGGNLFAQGTDVGFALGEVGPLRGFTYYGLDAGTDTGSTGVLISNQFPVGPGCLFGIYGTSGVPAVTNTLVDNQASNTFTPGATLNVNPDIGFYCLDRNGFPFSNAIVTGTDSATVQNGLFVNAIDGILLRNGGTTNLFHVNPSGITDSTGSTKVTTADSASITATTAATATFVFSYTALSPNTNYSFHCSGTTVQSTAGAGIGISVVTTGTATQLEAHATVATSATASGYQSTGSVSTTSASVVYIGATGTITTQLPWTIDGSIEVGATAPTNFAIGFYTAAGADGVVVKRDSYCTVR